MKVPLEWLQEFVAIRMAPEALAERLTLAGLEVTGIESVGGSPVFTLEVTPNRPDWLSIRGIAREVAAMTNQRMKPTADAARRAAKTAGTKFKIAIEDREGCRRYIGRLIEEVYIGPSPDWMQRRLAACGLKSINNVVDVTNYVLLETGQPLHAFDFDKLADATIVVRRAKAGETMVAIDGAVCKLSPETLVIADGKRPVAVAGVMGGRETEISSTTRRVLIESAWFDPILVRRTGRQLGLASESSYRFERGIDPEGVAQASARATELIEELSKGRLTGVQEAGVQPSRPIELHIESEAMTRWLGAPIAAPQITGGLEHLGFRVVKEPAGWRVDVPSHRLDVKREVDVYEEVARLHGYDRLATTVPTASLVSTPKDPGHVVAAAIRRLCAGLGLWEVVTWSLIAEEDLARLGWAAASRALTVSNPLSRDHRVLRPTLVHGLLATAARNVSHGQPDLRLFETGRCFDPDRQPAEHPKLGIAITGLWQRGWQGAQAADLFRLKGVVEELARGLYGATPVAAAVSLPWAEPGHSMALSIDGQPWGVLGEVRRALCDELHCGQRVWIAELAADRPIAASVARVVASSAFPPVKRDLSITVEKRLPFADVLGVIQRDGAPLVSRVELVDRYTGKQIPPDRHSLTFSIEYRDPSRTLTSAEVDERHKQIGQRLVERFGAQLR